jgi:hypothetical protein
MGNTLETAAKSMGCSQTRHNKNNNNLGNNSLKQLKRAPLLSRNSSKGGNTLSLAVDFLTVLGIQGKAFTRFVTTEERDKLLRATALQ